MDSTKIIVGNKVGIACNRGRESVGGLMQRASSFARRNPGMMYACGGADRAERQRRTMAFAAQTGGYGVIWFVPCAE